MAWASSSIVHYRRLAFLEPTATPKARTRRLLAEKGWAPRGELGIGIPAEALAATGGAAGA